MNRDVFKLDHCQITSIPEILERVKNDSFKYKSVRICAKVLKHIATNIVLVEDVHETEPGLDNRIAVDVFLVKDRVIEDGKTFEFLGEIEENAYAKKINDKSGVQLKCRVLKQTAGMQKLVYQHTKQQISDLITAQFSRFKQAELNEEKHSDV